MYSSDILEPEHEGSQSACVTLAKQAYHAAFDTWRKKERKTEGKDHETLKVSANRACNVATTTEVVIVPRGNVRVMAVTAVTVAVAVAAAVASA